MQAMNILEDRPAQAIAHPGTFRVLLVDDHHMMRLGLMALAASCSQLSIEWLESANLNDALRIYGDTSSIPSARNGAGKAEPLGIEERVGAELAQALITLLLLCMSSLGMVALTSHRLTLLCFNVPIFVGLASALFWQPLRDVSRREPVDPAVRRCRDHDRGCARH